MKRPDLRHRDLILFGPLIVAALGCTPAAPREAVVPEVPLSTSTAAASAKATGAPEQVDAPPPPRPVEARVEERRPPEEVPREEPIDLLDSSMVSGTGTPVYGGVVGGVVGGAVGGVVGGVIPAPPPSPTTTPARMAPNQSTSCVFPKESDDDKVDSARVVLRVTVNEHGKATKALVLADPGHGFGRAARECALRYTYEPGKDASGNSTTTDATLILRFER